MVKVKDRRVFQRLDGIVNVRYSVRGRDKAKTESIPRNIGGGGVGLCLAEDLRPGTLLDLEITVPDNPQKAILGTGQVRWTKSYGVIRSDREVNLYETGIEFIDVDPLSVGRVYTYVRQKQRM